METIKDLGDVLDFQWRDFERGGGTATLQNDQMAIEIVNKFEINKDTNALKLRVQNPYMWLINLYLHKGKCSKLQKLLEETFLKMNGAILLLLAILILI